MRLQIVRHVLMAVLLFGAFSAAAEIKIAVVHATKAIGECDEYQAKQKVVEDDLSPQADVLRALQQEIADLRDQLIKDDAILSNEAKRDHQKSIENKQIDLEFGAQKLQKENQDRLEAIVEDITPKFNAVVKDLIDLEGYDMVFNYSNYNQPVLLYVNPKHDITRRVTEGLNNKTEE